MSDDPNKRGGGDRDRINVQQEHELTYWTEKFKVSAERLKAAVAKVGPMVKDVQAELGK